METTASRLTAARLEADLTQDQLAKRAGCSQGLIGNLESGNQKSSTKLPAIAEALGVEVLWLAEGKGPKHRGLALTPGKVPLEVLTVRIFPLQCPKCGQRSMKSVMELNGHETIPCSCGHGIVVKDQYGKAEFDVFLEALGKHGFTSR